ncbi:hypothetical protein D3C84_1117410 [compost metagenome]|nr:hypothetical protein BSF44_22600 [Pseudomonas sp. ACN8]
MSNNKAAIFSRFRYTHIPFAVAWLTSSKIAHFVNLQIELELSTGCARPYIAIIKYIVDISSLSMRRVDIPN